MCVGKRLPVNELRIRAAHIVLEQDSGSFPFWRDKLAKAVDKEG
jgi:hypothetical protein